MSSLNKFTVLFSAIAFLIPVPALAEWVPITSTPDGTIMYVETDSIDLHAPDSSESGPTASFLQRTEYLIPEENNGLKDLQMNRSVDCYTGKVYTHSYIGLDDKGHTLFNKGTDERPSFMGFGTVGGEIRSFVCSNSHRN